MRAQDTVDAGEVARFERIGARWWDPKGPMAPLHAMQPARLDYILDQIGGGFGRDPQGPKPLEGLRVLDIGCGGGLLCEPMARLGADVTGLDAAPAAVEAARAHAALMGLEIDYREGAAEDLAAEAAAGAFEPVDVLLCMEIVEHVADRAAFFAAAGRLVKPGGLLLASTLNRTAKSFLMAILGAEFLLRWLPIGTHDWRKFPTPEELGAELAAAGLTVVDRCGFTLDPLSRSWRLSPQDLSVNYAIAATRAA